MDVLNLDRKLVDSRDVGLEKIPEAFDVWNVNARLRDA